MEDQTFELLKSDIIHLRSEIKILRAEKKELVFEMIMMEQRMLAKLDSLLSFKWKLTGIVSFIATVGTLVSGYLINFLKGKI